MYFFQMLKLKRATHTQELVTTEFPPLILQLTLPKKSASFLECARLLESNT